LNQDQDGFNFSVHQQNTETCFIISNYSLIANRFYFVTTEIYGFENFPFTFQQISICNYLNFDFIDCISFSCDSSANYSISTYFCL